MDRYVKKLQELGALNIEKSVKLKGFNCDYSGRDVNNKPLIVLDKAEKQISKILKISDLVKYYGSFDGESKEWIFYRLEGGRFEPLDEEPRLNRELLNKINDWLNNTYREIEPILVNDDFGLRRLKFYIIILALIENEDKELRPIDLVNYLNSIINEYNIESDLDIDNTSPDSISKNIKVDIEISSIPKNILVEQMDEFALSNILSSNKSRKKYGVFYLPNRMIDFYIKLLNKEIKNSSNVLDGFARDGRILTAVKSKNNNIHAVGFDTNTINKDIGKIRSAILGQQNTFISKDFLKTKISKCNVPETYELIISEPPFGRKVKDNKIDKKYSLSNKYNDYQIFAIEKYLKLLRPGGTLLTVLTSNILRTGKHQKFREFLLKHYKLRAVISFQSIDRYLVDKRYKVDKSILIMNKKRSENDNPKNVFMASPTNQESLTEILEGWRRFNE